MPGTAKKKRRGALRTVGSWYYLAPWDFAAQYAPAPVQRVPQQCVMSFGTFLAVGTMAVSAVVLFKAKASKEAKAVARIALGTAVPFLLTKVFDWQAWPEPQWN